MASDDAAQRFGQIRSTPPDLPTRPSWGGAIWLSSRLGGDGGFPNGGMWRFDADVGSLVVKRTGAAFLGDDPIWQLSLDPANPQWWGREAAFYASELATDGWAASCTPAECVAIDARPDETDLWLEDVRGIPLPADRYEDAVVGLASWQAHHRASPSVSLSRNWLVEHLRRRQLDNAKTLAHSGWATLAEAGISEAARRWANSRVTYAEVAAGVLAELPQLPTHHDFHHMNIGSIGDRIAVIDWATVGWGPVGHDVGNLVMDRASEGDLDVADLWSRLRGCAATIRRRHRPGHHREVSRGLSRHQTRVDARLPAPAER